MKFYRFVFSRVFFSEKERKENNMSGECCEAAIEGGTCNGCEMLDSQSSTSDTEEYSSFPQATPNRRHASLKVYISLHFIHKYNIFLSLKSYKNL